MIACSETKHELVVSTDTEINMFISKSTPLFQAWTDMDSVGSLVANRAKHDLIFSDTWLFEFGFDSDNLFDNKLYEEELEHARLLSDELRAINPDIIILCELYYREGIVNEHLDEDSPYWIRNEAGIVPAWGEDLNGNGVMELSEFETGLIDFTEEAIIEAVASKAFALEQTGLFDGVMLDWWSESSITAATIGDDRTYLSLSEERVGRIELLKRIRSKVSSDFLILVNSNDDIVPLSAKYINGLYMECYKEDYDKGYTLEQMQKIESTLLWADENLLSPQINCLEGWRVVSDLKQSDTEIIEERSSDENLRWMRAFTSMSLVLSDGYVLFSDDNALSIADHGHNDYDFWWYNIGEPVESYKVLRDHVYIRSYDNALVIYNGSSENYTYQYIEHGKNKEVIIPSLDGLILMNN